MFVSNPRLFWSCLGLAGLILSCGSDPRGSGVISTGNAGRIKVSTIASDSLPATTGEIRLLEATDSIANARILCRAMKIDSLCTDSVAAGTYRAEIWISGHLAGRSGWFRVDGSTKDIRLGLSLPTLLRLQIGSASSIDSVILGSRTNAGKLVEGKWELEQVRDSSDHLWVKFRSAGTSSWSRYNQEFTNGQVLVASTETNSPSIKPSRLLVLGPGDATWSEATIIGGLSGSSERDNLLYCTDTTRGLGAAWDASTVGRTLWKISLPDSLRSRSLLSARLIYRTASWGARPATSGSMDYAVEGHRMLRAWKGCSVGYGTPNSASTDGVTSTQASWGISWNTYLVGLDGIDAEVATMLKDTLADQSLAPFDLNVTAAVEGWLRDPASNFGMIFRSPTERSGTYPDYPVFWSNTAPNAWNRPRLLLEFAP